VIASRTGPLPEIVGPAGIVVEPRDPGRMAMALRAMWLDGPVAHQVRRTAQQRSATASRSWADVARDTRRAYQAAALDDAVG
jgi:glycosyltransferase involved in cell wall biosynthesis